MPEDPDRPPAHARDSLARIYDLAERLNAEITRPQPDWGQVARHAYALGRAAVWRSGRPHEN